MLIGNLLSYSDVQLMTSFLMMQDPVHFPFLFYFQYTYIFFSKNDNINWSAVLDAQGRLGVRRAFHSKRNRR